MTPDMDTGTLHGAFLAVAPAALAAVGALFALALAAVASVELLTSSLHSDDRGRDAESDHARPSRVVIRLSARRRHGAGFGAGAGAATRAGSVRMPAGGAAEVLGGAVGARRWRRMERMACFDRLLQVAELRVSSGVCGRGSGGGADGRPKSGDCNRSWPSAGGATEEQCCICLDLLENEAGSGTETGDCCDGSGGGTHAVRLVCGHTYHRSCVLRFLLKCSNRCPLCNTPFVVADDCDMLESVLLHPHLGSAIPDVTYQRPIFGDPVSTRDHAIDQSSRMADVATIPPSAVSDETEFQEYERRKCVLEPSARQIADAASTLSSSPTTMSLDSCVAPIAG
jgi:hypothetical protein